MFYNISRTLSVFPWLCWGIIALVLLPLEIKAHKEQSTGSPGAAPGRSRFILPPGDGYEYFVTAHNICYILNKSKKQYRVYVIEDVTPGVGMKHDRYGDYFTVKAPDFSTAEKIVDTTFGL